MPGTRLHKAGHDGPKEIGTASSKARTIDSVGFAVDVGSCSGDEGGVGGADDLPPKRLLTNLRKRGELATPLWAISGLDRLH
jgi:hypothetical protein